MADEKKETAPVVAENVEAAAAAETAKAPAADVKRKKGGRYVPSGIAFILATFNNTKVTFTDLHGNVLCWSTSGKNGFKGSRKSTAYAAQVVAADAAKKAEALGRKWKSGSTDRAPEENLLSEALLPSVWKSMRSRTSLLFRTTDADLRKDAVSDVMYPGRGSKPHPV